MADNGNNHADLHQCLETDPKYVDEINFLKSKLETFQDFPRPGISFKDTFALTRDTEAYQRTIDLLSNYIAQLRPDKIVGLEARGFTFGGAICYKLGVPFIPARKKGKLPGPCKTIKYALEYGEDVIQIQEDVIKPNERVVIIDDLIATGGTLNAAINLITEFGAQVVESVVIAELQNLGWETVVKSKVTSLIRL